MKKILYTISVVAAILVAATSSASAQNLEYAYGHSIEILGGWAGTPFTVNVDARKATSIACGADFGGRYTYFFGKHFGIYGQLMLAGTDANERNYYSTVNKADGNKYSYNPYSSYVQESNSYSPTMTAGAAFRYDKGKLSVRPRVGVGFAIYDNDCDGTYIRYDRNDHTTPGSYYYTIYREPSYDYIVSDYSSNTVCDMPTFLVQASLQLTYTIRTHFYFSAEAGCNYMTAPMEKVRGYYDAVSAYNPETWVDAVADSDYKDVVVPDYNHPHETSTMTRVGSLLYFNIGVGWNIGWNRNERGWYNRR